MSDRSKHRLKEQTAFQLNSRQSRNYLSAKMVSIVRANDRSSEFSAQELIQLESLLRDELQTNPWLLNVCKAISDESVVVSKEELELYNKYQTEGQDVCVTQPEVEELDNELEFLRERVHVLRYSLKDLTEKLTEIRKNDSNDTSNEIESKSMEKWLKLRIKLMEFLESMRTDLSADISVEEPKRIVHQMMAQLNHSLGAIDGIQDPNKWLSRQLDGLALSDVHRRQASETFNEQICHQLEAIHKNVMNLYKELVRIKEFYEINIREEMSWRTDLNTLLAHLQSFNESKVIQLNSPQIESNGWTARRELCAQYSKLLERVENQEFDELRALIEALRERIEILSDKTK